MKTIKLFWVVLFGITVAACGGGGGSNGGGTGGTTSPSYVVQGGLTWMPETFQDTWANASAYCANTTINGQTGWRMPTQAELSALYASGLMKGHGWALSYDWSSTSNGAGNHYTVGLYDGSVHTTSETSTFYVSCVRTYINGGGGGNSGGSGGIIFSGILNGVNSISNTSYQNGAMTAGARTVATGSSYAWDETANRPLSAMLIYNSSTNYVQFGFGLAYYVKCKVNARTSTFDTLCSDVGVTFDSAAGVVTFSATPISSFITPININATGSMTFSPF